MERSLWTQRAEEHGRRVDVWTQPHLSRRRDGIKHPVHDFLFTYYSYSPAALRRWHPGFGTCLADAPEYADLRGYLVGPDGSATVSDDYLRSHQPLITSTRHFLTRVADRAPTFGCFGLHEWAMVYRADETRHPVPLRLGAAGTDEVVETHRIRCSHFDAFRFFTAPAIPLNTLQPGREDRGDFEQPGCLHATMDLYKHAFRLSPLLDSDLIADCFDLAWRVRDLDMRASPYDLADYGYQSVAIETPEGKVVYAEAQRGFAEEGARLRGRLIDECVRLLQWAHQPSARQPTEQ